MKKHNYALFIVLAILLAVVLQRSVVEHRSGTPESEAVATNKPGTALPERGAPTASYPPAVFSQVGKPGQALPFPRGENQQRQHEAPVRRELAAGLRQNAPLAMAMKPQDGRIMLLPEETDLHTLRARRMVLDTTALDKVLNGQTARLLAPTTTQEAILIHIHSVKSRSSQSHTLFGRVEGEEDTSDVQLVYHDGILHGTISRHVIDQHLEYRILADGHMVVREIDHSTMTAKCGNPGETPEQTAERIRQELDEDGISLETVPSDGDDTSQDTTGWTTIDVVVGYDQASRVADGGVSQIEARIISSVDGMSTAFANSLITNTELMLLGTIEDPAYVFPGTVSGSMGGDDELGNLNNTSDGKLDAVTNYATLLGADLRSFVVKQADGSAGIAYLPGNSSITARDYMTSTRLTFAHELGHNLGCDHSWGDSSQSYHSRYGWRFIGTSGTKARTIMAYDWDWGNRVPYFANPAVSYLGAATGAVNGYNVLNDPRADQRYYVGGIGYPGSSATRTGFNGANAALGANNAMLIKNGSSSNSAYGATFASRRATRATLAVTSPAAGVEWLAGTARNISYRGGDMDFTASVQLYRGGVLQQTISSGFNAINRNLTWTVPSNLPVGNNYMVRVTLTHPVRGNVSVDSGLFTITNLATTVVSQTPASTSPTPAPLSSIAVTFSAVMNAASFSTASDIRSFTGPGGEDLKPSITGTAWSLGNTRLTVNFTPQADLGYYRMVFSGQMKNANGTPLDQDRDGKAGELVEDSYVALVWVVASGTGLQTIWTDLVGNDALDGGWAFPTSAHSWATGNAAENGTTGPNAGADGNPILATRLNGNYNSGESTFIASPTINCGGFTGVTISMKIWRGAGRSDQLYFDVWHNGQWKLVNRIYGAATTAGTNDGAWVTFSPNLVSTTGENLGDNNSAFRLRFGVFDNTAQSVTPSTGWQVDSIVMQGIRTPTAPPHARVIAHNPSGTDPALVSSVWLDFSQPMDTAGFSLADITSFTGPSGNITATGFSWIHDSMLRIDFPSQSQFGNYAINLSPQIPDTMARNLDQDRDGTPGEALQDGYSASFVIGILAGPVHHFAITGIGAIQTVGSPISGITITAQDAANYTATSFNGNVSFGGTGGFSGNSASFVNGVLDNVSVTPTVAGTNLSLTVNDGAGHAGSTNITTIRTLYDAWAGGMSPEDDANGDGVANGMAWVLGAAAPGSDVTNLMPTINDATDPEFFTYTYRRRSAVATSPGTTVAVQHGDDIAEWDVLTHDGVNVIITVTDGFYGAGVDKVECRIKRTFAPSNRLFLRLSADVFSQQTSLEE